MSSLHPQVWGTSKDWLRRLHGKTTPTVHMAVPEGVVEIPSLEVLQCFPSAEHPIPSAASDKMKSAFTSVCWLGGARASNRSVTIAPLSFARKLVNKDVPGAHREFMTSTKSNKAVPESQATSLVVIPYFDTTPKSGNDMLFVWDAPNKTLWVCSPPDASSVNVRKMLFIENFLKWASKRHSEVTQQPVNLLLSPNKTCWLQVIMMGESFCFTGAPCTSVITDESLYTERWELLVKCFVW